MLSNAFYIEMILSFNLKKKSHQSQNWELSDVFVTKVVSNFVSVRLNQMQYLLLIHQCVRRGLHLCL